MPLAIAVAVLLVGAGAWAIHRRTEPPIMRRRINAGTDRYFAERAASRVAEDEGVDGAVDLGDDGDGDD
jgi:hypothetical protein